MPKPLQGLNCCVREALDSQTDFQDEPVGPFEDKSREDKSGAGFHGAVSDIFAGLFACSRADLLPRQLSRDEPTGPQREPELLPDGFEILEGYDCSARGAGGDRMPIVDIEACKQRCRERGYGAFVVRAGMAYFRRESAEEIRAMLVRSRGATAFIDTIGPETKMREGTDRDASLLESGLHSGRGESKLMDHAEPSEPGPPADQSSSFGSRSPMQMLSGFLGKLQSPASTAASSGGDPIPDVQDEHKAVFGGSNPMSTRPPASWSPSGDPIDEDLPAENGPPPVARASFDSAHPGSASRSPRTPTSSGRGLAAAGGGTPTSSSRGFAAAGGGTPTSSGRGFGGGSPGGSAGSPRPAGSALDKLAALLSEGEQGHSGSNRSLVRTSSLPGEPHRSSLDSMPADTGATGAGISRGEAGQAGTLEGAAAWAEAAKLTEAQAKQPPPLPSFEAKQPPPLPSFEEAPPPEPPRPRVPQLQRLGQEPTTPELPRQHAPLMQESPPPEPFQPEVVEEPPPELPQVQQLQSAQAPVMEQVQAPVVEEPPPPPDPYQAQADACQQRLDELQDALQAVDRDLKSAPPEKWGPIMGVGLRRARGLDQEAASAVEKLPVAAAAAAALAEQQQSLHENVLKLEASARPYMKEPPKASSGQQAGLALPGSFSGEAPTLHARLDDLSSALQAWAAALDRNKRESTGSTAFTAVTVDVYGGSHGSSMSLQHEELMVERASAAFEEFRIGLTASATVEAAAAARRSAGLLRALTGFSQWGDVEKIQELLRLRKAFLLDPAMDPNAMRFTCGRLFLQQVAQKEKWPSAEPLTARWRDALVRTLGPRGSADWKERAMRLPAQARVRAGDLKQLPEYGTLFIRKIRAQNLRGGGSWEETNPYVVFEFAGAKRQTGVVWNNRTNPEWLKKDDPSAWEEIRFDVEDLRQQPVLRVSLWDHDRYAADDALGHLDDPGLNLVELLTSPPPLPRKPAFPSTTERKDGVSRALQRLGFGKSEVQEAREAEEREAALNQHKAACERLLRDRESRHPVEVDDDGSVTCQLHPLMLVGEGVGREEASVQFEIFYQTGAAGDPLVLQPEADDDALVLLGHVEEQLRGYEEAFLACNEGFFLTPADCRADLPFDSSVKRSLGMPGNYNHVSPQISDEVFKYNRLLDRLNIMTTDHKHGGPEAALLGGGTRLTEHGTAVGGEDIQQREWSDQFTVAAEEFTALTEQLRLVERTVGNDMATRRFFAFQDELLPTAGEWSIDRRRRLRNQVFLASLEVEHRRKRQQRSAEPQRQALGSLSVQHLQDSQPVALALCGALSIYGVAMCALIFGGGGQGWVMLSASVLALACLVFAGYLYGSRLLNSLGGQQFANYTPLTELPGSSTQDLDRDRPEVRTLTHNPLRNTPLP